MTVQLGQIGQIAMPAKDIRRAVAFYRDKRGMKFLFEAPPALAFFDCAGVRLMISVPENAEFANHGSVLYFTVNEIQSAYNELRDGGVQFVDAPHVIHKTPQYELWMAFFRDSEENMLALMAEKPL
jgi:predicted enzyme related to lactoylglutathione lyase